MLLALIHENSIKVGPRDWHYWIFRRYLEENDLSYSELPLTFTEAIINENWKLLPVTELVTPECNFLFEQYEGPFWTMHDTYVTGYYNVVSLPIEGIKSQLKSKIALDRYNYEVDGIDVSFPDGTTVEAYTNREDRGIYLDTYLIMSDTDTFDFKFKNDVFKTVSKAELYLIITAGVQHIKAAFQWETQKNAEINNAQTVDDLKLIDITCPFTLKSPLNE